MISRLLDDLESAGETDACSPAAPWDPPISREFTGPGRRNRIDYGFASPVLLADYLVDIHHVTDTVWHHADHLPVAFML